MNQEQIEKILALLSKGIDVNDPRIPAEVREMMKRAEEKGAKVAALTSEQVKSLNLPIEVLEKLNALSLHINPDHALDPHADRYAPVIRFSPLITSEVTDRITEIANGPGGLDALYDPNGPVTDEDFRLCILAMGEIEVIDDGENAPGEERALLFALRHAGFENIFDAYTSGPHRLKRMGFGKQMLTLLSNMVHQTLLPLQARSEEFVLATLDELTKPVPMAPLPFDDTFNEEFDSAFMVKRFPPALLIKLRNAGLTNLSAIFANGSPDETAALAKLTQREQDQLSASLAACADSSPEAEEQMDMLLDRALDRHTSLDSPLLHKKMAEVGGEDFKIIESILGEIGMNFVEFAKRGATDRQKVIDLFKSKGFDQARAEHSADHLAVHINQLNRRGLERALHQAAEIGPEAFDEVMRRLPPELASDLAPLLQRMRTAVNMKFAAESAQSDAATEEAQQGEPLSTAVDQPVVRAALTADTVNTLLDSGITDLQMLDGEIPSPVEPHLVLKKLSASERGDIRDITRVLGNCGCSGCKIFRKEYFAENPRIKAMLDAQQADNDGKNLH